MRCLLFLRLYNIGVHAPTPSSGLMRIETRACNVVMGTLTQYGG